MTMKRRAFLQAATAAAALPALNASAVAGRPGGMRSGVVMATG